MDGFFTASDEEIRSGRTTDVYFSNTERVLKRSGLDSKNVWADFTATSLPDGWNQAVFAGLSEVIELMIGRKVDLYSLPEGTIFPARDIKNVPIPVMSVEGPYGEFCSMETPALGLICQATGIATRSARIKKLAGDRKVASFGIRRMHPAIAPMLDRYAYVGGCDGVSGVLGAEACGIDPTGTMPHALIITAGDQKDAWRLYHRYVGEGTGRIALIDTYCDEKGESIMAAEELGDDLDGVRIDTHSSRRGNIRDIVTEVRWELDIRGYEDVKIMVSGGINEDEMRDLSDLPVDGYGVGTYITNSPTVNYSMDLVSMEGKPVAKRGKFGGRKEVYRCHGCGDFLVLPRDRPVPECLNCGIEMSPMLVKYLHNGEQKKSGGSAKEIRERVLDSLDSLIL